MNSIGLTSKQLFLTLAATLSIVAHLDAAVSLSIIPAAVSNTYSGNITLNIAGLNSGETVLIQKYIDVNGNGVIEPGDWLVQQYPLTDGQACVIGGVTNINVPGDSTGTDTSIVSLQSFVNAGVSQQLLGQYLYRLSSPSARFPAITNAFTVTNAVYAQSVTGTVRANGTNVPNASVLLFVPSTGGGMGSPIGGAIADNSGHYSIQLPPGTYLPWAFKMGYVTDFSTIPTVTLGSGATITTNLLLLPSTLTISGQTMDAANSSLKLPGLMAGWQSTNNLMAIGFTDPTGTFSVGVTASLWQWGGDNAGLVSQGYLDFRDQGRPIALTTTGSVGNVAVAFPKGTALFYGTVKDDQNRPLAGISLSASQNNGSGLYEGDATTDQNGHYTLAVTAGPWDLEISKDKSAALGNYLFPRFNSLAINDGQAVHQTFLGILATNHITGHLRDNNNNPISGVSIWASATINSVNYNQGNVTTDNNGYYSLNVANGIWNVGISTCTDCGDALPGNYLAPQNQSVGINGNDQVVNFTAPLANNQVTGQVRDSNSNPIGGVGVWASATLNGVYYFQYVIADGSGNFALSVANGVWSVGLESSGGNGNLDSILGPGNYQSPNSQDVTINNANVGVNFTVQLCTGVQILTTSLPNGQVYAYYDQFLEGSACNNNFNWSLNAGNNLPPGLNLGSNGEIFGNPTASGPYNFSVHVDDGNGHSANQNLSLTITPAPAPLQVTTGFLPDATNGSFYSQTLQATGGQTPYSWSLAPYSAALPPNLSLAANGVLSGTPVTGGTFYFYARVTDAAVNTADSPMPIQLNIVNPPLQITNTTLLSGTLGAAYSVRLGATGGQSPYSWTLANGSAGLPPGLLLDSTGLIYGVPSTSGTFNFMVQANDAALAFRTKPLVIVINGKPVLGSPVWVNNRFQMRLTGATGQTYTIQMSTNPAFANCTSLLITNNAQTNSFIVADPNPTNSTRYYRVKVGL